MKKILPFVILIGVILLYTSPFFRTGFFPTHDGAWAVVRLAEIEREVKDGQLPPRWSDYLNHGFGYPLFLYTYPFPFYLGLPFRLFHIGLTNTIKIIFVLSVILSGIFMFLLGKTLAGTYAGLLSAIFYTIAPYRLVNLYVRGSIGESLSLAIFPLLFYLGIKFLEKQTQINLVCCSIVFAILILTHNVMALLFLPIWIIFLLIIPIQNKPFLLKLRIIPPMLLLGLGLAAYFFIPAIAEKKYIVLSQIKLADTAHNFINLSDYLNSAWSYGIKPSFQLGWFQILSSAVGLISVFTLRKTHRQIKLPVVLYISVGIFVCIFLAHPASSFLWNYPPLSWLDFPWRLLGPLVFLSALSTVYLSIHKITGIIGFLLVAFALIYNFNLSKPAGYINQPDSYYATNDATTTSADELMPIWVKNKPTQRYSDKIQIEKGDSDISDLKYNSKMINFRLTAHTKSQIKINSVYFPGWEYNMDGKPISIFYQSPDGLVRLDVPIGSHQINGTFNKTPVRIIADMISLFSVFSVIVILLVSLRSCIYKRL